MHVSSKTIPEIDISYFFTPNIAAELILTYPQKHDVTLDGNNIGTFKHLPPTLSLQYHFMPEKRSLNFDIKKVQIRSDVFIGGAKASEVKVDPLLIGVGYRF